MVFLAPKCSRVMLGFSFLRAITGLGILLPHRAVAPGRENWMMINRPTTKVRVLNPLAKEGAGAEASDLTEFVGIQAGCLS
jgi:hypothetical protein